MAVEILLLELIPVLQLAAICFFAWIALQGMAAGFHGHGGDLLWRRGRHLFCTGVIGFSIHHHNNNNNKLSPGSPQGFLGISLTIPLAVLSFLLFSCGLSMAMFSLAWKSFRGTRTTFPAKVELILIALVFLSFYAAGTAHYVETVKALMAAAA